MASYAKSQKGADLLQFKGYLYSREKLINNKIIWKCTENKIHECRGRCHTIDGSLVKITEHNHVADSTRIEVKHVINTFKEKAKTTNDPPLNIVCDTALSTKKSTSGVLPKIKL